MNQALRIQTSLINAAEKKILVWLAKRQPRWVTSDMLTVVGTLGALIVAIGFVLSNNNVQWLWLSSLGLVINWYGDSLDGTLARTVEDPSQRRISTNLYQTRSHRIPTHYRYCQHPPHRHPRPCRHQPHLPHLGAHHHHADSRLRRFGHYCHHVPHLPFHYPLRRPQVFSHGPEKAPLSASPRYKKPLRMC